MEKVEVVDLFCGVGGLSYGFKNENFKIKAGIDNDVTCKPVFEKNVGDNTFITQDIKKVISLDVNNLYSSDAIKVLVGCAPCQPFSSYTSSNNTVVDSTTEGTEKEKKWQLLNYFGKLITDIQPTIVSMENVPQLATKDKYSVFKEFTTLLQENGYYFNPNPVIVYCPNYGIPQNRKRLVLLASKLGEINLIPPTHTKENYPTVRSTISHLPSVEDGAVSSYSVLHKSQKLSPTNKTRIKSIKEGQSWIHMPIELVNPCHTRTGGSSYGDVYGRMKWDEPAPTMTTHCTGYGNGRFGHPEQDRAISLLEAALFQTFPESYFETGGQLVSTIIQRHIGNAVPVKLGEVIAKSIKAHLIAHNIKDAAW